MDKAQRSTKPCPMCGRLIFCDHNLAGLNFDKHVGACPEQQARKRRAEGRAYIRKMSRLGGVDFTPPMLGQIGFPFDDVPEEVGA